MNPNTTEMDNTAISKDELLADIKEALQEVKLSKEGKIKLKPAWDFSMNYILPIPYKSSLLPVPLHPKNRSGSKWFFSNLFILPKRTKYNEPKNSDQAEIVRPHVGW